jgi:hypothetical protein
MKKYTKEDKLRIASAYVPSEAYNLFNDMLTELIDAYDYGNEPNFEAGEGLRAFYCAGIRKGLEMARELPGKVKEENTKYFDKLYERMVNGKGEQ